MSALLRAWRPTAKEWDRSAALHLLRRAGFGASPEELERALEQGLESTLERLFADDTPTELRDAIRPVLAMDDLELVQAWWMALILAGTAPLRERMPLVWHDLFATSHDKVDDVRLMHAQNELLRRGALGDFRALLHGLARDPAMLVWLDGNSNRKEHPNENFARELMELFALGAGNYGERDIRETARAFSGWGTAGRAFRFAPEHHDGRPKTILGHTGPWDGDQAIDLLLEHPACARHVARVLLEAFVAPGAEGPWIEAVADALRAGKWDVGAVLHVLLRSELFFSPSARRNRIAGPVECLAVAQRAVGARLAPRDLARRAAAMGQALFRPPSVKGWDGGRAWIHAGYWIARHNALVELVRSVETGSGGRLAAGSVSEVLQSLLPEEPSVLRAALERLAHGPPGEGAPSRAALALVLTSPEFQLF